AAYYLLAREYDPSTGRFTQQDAYPGALDAPASLNKYTYADNSPANLTDPTGNAAKDRRRTLGTEAQGYVTPKFRSAMTARGLIAWTDVSIARILVQSGVYNNTGNPTQALNTLSRSLRG